MKLLLVIESEKNFKDIADKGLRAIGRLAYQKRIFVPIRQEKKYRKAVDDANWNWYLMMDLGIVVAGQNPDGYCKANNIDLKVTIPDNILEVWYGEKWKTANFEKRLVTLCKNIELARQGFELGRHKTSKKIADGVYMEKVL